LRCPQEGFTLEKLKATLGPEYLHTEDVRLRFGLSSVDDYVYLTVRYDVATDLLCWAKAPAFPILTTATSVVVATSPTRLRRFCDLSTSFLLPPPPPVGRMKENLTVLSTREGCIWWDRSFAHQLGELLKK
jgi:hypothetical protein